MIAFVVYDPATGRVLRGGKCPAAVVPHQAQSGEAVLRNHDLIEFDPHLHMVGPDGERLDRPDGPWSIDKTSIVADDVDVATISGLPEGMTIRANGVVAEVDATGVVEVSSDKVGEIRVEGEAWPWRPLAITITATAPP